ncbi:MAG: glycosyltransferase family 4 protein [bacterium]
MKIAMIGQKGVPTKYGGIERHVEELSAALVSLGHQVVVYTRPHYTDPSLGEYRGVKLISLPSLHTKHLDAISHTLLATIHALFVEKAVDVIHYHGVGPSLLCFLPRLFKPFVKVVSTFHCVDALHGKWNWFARLTLRLGEWMSVSAPHATIAVAESLKHYCEIKFGKSPTYIPNGILNANEFLSDCEFTKRFQLLPKQYVVLVQRLVKHKGVHYLLDAWKDVLTAYPLVIVGGSAYTDDYVASLKQQVKDLGLERKVKFLGYRQGAELASLMKNACLFVSPSTTEGLPIAVLEAMSVGTPVLLSDIPEHLEVLRDDNGSVRYGFTFQNQSATSLAAELSKLFQQLDTVAEIGKSAELRVKAKYNWDMIVHQTESLYQSLLEPRTIRKEKYA